MSKLVKPFLWIRARHIFGVIMVTMALGIVQRPVGTVTIIANQFGLLPIQYALIVAICGTVMLLVRLPLFWRSLITLPFLAYIVFSIEFAMSNAGVPVVPVIMYCGLYMMLLYFMVNEEIRPYE